MDTGLRDCMSEVSGEFETAVHGCMTDSVEFMNAMHGCKAEAGEFEAALHGFESETGEFEVKVHGCMLEASRRGVVAGTCDSWRARALKRQAFCEKSGMSSHLVDSAFVSAMHVRFLFIPRWCPTIRVVCLV